MNGRRLPFAAAVLVFSFLHSGPGAGEAGRPSAPSPSGQQSSPGGPSVISDDGGAGGLAKLGLEGFFGRLGALLDFVEEKGLNDPGSPVHFEEPLGPGSFHTVVALLGRLEGEEGLRTVIEGPEAWPLAREVDQAIPGFLRGSGPSPVILEAAWDVQAGDPGGARKVQVRVQNVGGSELREVSVVVIASILEGAGADPSRAEAAPAGRTVHTFRIVPMEPSPLGVGDLGPGEIGVGVGPSSWSPPPGTVVHLYYLVLYRDPSNVLRSALPSPQRVGSGRGSPLEPVGRATTPPGAPAPSVPPAASLQSPPAGEAPSGSLPEQKDGCLPRGLGMLVNTRVPACLTGYECTQVIGDRVVFLQNE